MDATLAQIEKEAEAQVGRIGPLSDWTKSFKTIEARVDEFVTQQIDTFSGDVDSISKLIKDRRERLSLSSGITTQIVNICQQVLAFGAAGVALIAGFGDKIRQFSIPVQKSFAIAGIFYLELIFLSLVVLLWYMLQARFRYPSLYFDRIGNAWPFFYYATVTQVRRRPIQGPRARFAASVTYATDFLKFTDTVLSEKPKERLRTELQQYFLLMSYQAYVHQFSLRLANMFIYGFTGAICTAAILFVALYGGFI